MTTQSDAQPIFAVQYSYGAGAEAAAQRDEHRPAHRDFLVSLGPAMAAAGAYTDDPTGALLLIKAESAEAVHALLEDDPFNVHGLIASVRVNQWSCAIGDRAEAIRATGATGS